VPLQKLPDLAWDANDRVDVIDRLEAPALIALPDETARLVDRQAELT
jgi:hypothetical protein